MSYFNNHKKVMYVFGGIILLLAIIVPRVFKSNTSTDQTSEYKPLVSVISVDNYLGDIRQIDTDAKIESKGQVEMRSQVSAPVQSVNVGIGDKVYAGQTLLVLKNDDVSAQVSQANANLAAAEAKLADTKKGTRSEEMAIYEQQYANAERDMNNAVRDAYTKIDDSVRNKSDFLFKNPGTKNPEIIVRTQDRTIESAINQKRILLGEKLDYWKNTLFVGGINKDKETEISKIITLAKEYFDSLSNIVNDLSFANSGTPQTTIDGYRSSVSGAQMQVNGASTAYSAAVSVWRVADDNLSLRKAGATTEQLALVEASVAQAQAALQGAQAAYNKYVITSPMDGTISVLPFRLGDLVSPGSVIASVVNESGLELKGYVSSDDASYVKEGDKALVDNRYNAQISRVSPSVDPQTKKVEVKIAVTDATTTLVVGGLSHVKIFSSSPSTTSDVIYTLPISAVRVSNSGAYVYAIASSSEETDLQKIVAYPVKVSEVTGEMVKVAEGINKGMNIITPTIGLKDGASVRIKK